MRLNDKLLHKNCPSCGVEIMLGESALNKKINCPKCRQVVIIAGGDHAAPVKVSAKKAAPKERTSIPSVVARKSPVVVEEPEPQTPVRSRNGGEAPAAEEFGDSVPEKKAVVYCICNGVLKKCKDSRACCCAPAHSGEYVETVAL